jgi:HK97 family phage portal protein
VGLFARAFRLDPTAAQSPEELERILRAQFGGATRSGTSVTPETALGVGAVFACVRVLSEDVAKLPLILHRRREDGGKERAVDHPLYALMHDRPNSYQTAFEFREMMQAHLALRGNAFAFVTRVGGQVRELLPIAPDRVRPKIDDQWNVTYEVRTGPTPRDTQTFTPRDVLHLRGLATDGLVGLSPVTLAREAIGLSMAAEQHGARFFKNGAKPGLVVTHPGELSDTGSKNLRESIEAAASGDNVFRLLLLEEDMKATVVGLNHTDAQYIESRKFQIPEVARWYRMPLHKIQDLDRSTNNNIEEQSRAYLTDTLDPWLTRWKQRLNESLLSPVERKEYFFDFLTEALLRGDTKNRYDAYHQAIQDGWMSRNEVRVRENLNPEPGLDEFLRPLNMDTATSQRDGGTDE